MRNQFFTSILMISSTICLFSGCRENDKNSENLKSDLTKYEYRIKTIQYDIDSVETQIIEVYIDSKNDSTAHQKIVYKNGVLDSSQSRFYKLDLNRNANTNTLEGAITYFYNKEIEGSIVSLDFIAISKMRDSTEFVEFSIDNSNSIKFQFPNESDTLIGFMYLQHSKDTIVEGERMIRLRERYFPIDNYKKTNNPFVHMDSIK